MLLFALQIAWTSDVDAALAQAKKESRHVLVLFTVAGSEAVARMDKDTFGDPATAAFSNRRFVHVRLEAAKAKALVEKHEIDELPAALLLSAAGERIYLLEGYQSPESFQDAVEETLAVWAKLQALKPDSAARWVEAAGLREQLNDGRRAAEAYRKAAGLAADPKDKGAWLVKTFERLNELSSDEAVNEQIQAVAKELDALDPKLGFADDAAYARAMVDYNKEDWDEAIKKLEDVAARFPDADRAPWALLGLADLFHHAKKDHAKAVAHVQRILDKHKSGPWADRAKHFLEHIEAHAEKKP